jgi:hypothetical protein
MGPRAALHALEDRDKFRLCRDLNPDSSVVQPLT